MHFSVQFLTYLIINQVKSMLLFEKQESVLVRERNWKVVVEINYENILSDSITIDKLMLNFNKTLNILKEIQKVSDRELSIIDKHVLEDHISTYDMFVKYKAEVDGTIDLLPKFRKKRGLINLGGTILNKLFGVMDDDDRDSIDKKFSELNDKTSLIVTDNKRELTIIKNLNAVTNNNTENINKIINHLNMYDLISQRAFSQNLNNLTSTIHDIETYIQIAGVLKNIENCILQATNKIFKLRTGLTTLFLGKLTSELIPEDQLLAILLDVEKHINNSYKLPFTVSKNKIINYFSILKEHTIIRDDQIIMILELPLLDKNAMYELSEIKSLPIFHKELNHFVVENIEKKYIAVNEGYDKYFYMTENDVEKCTRLMENTLICQEKIIHYANSISASDDCIWNTLRNLTSNSTEEQCKTKLLAGNTKLYVISLYNDINFSTAKQKIPITLQCVAWTQNSLEIINNTFYVENVGRINSVKGCKILTPEFEFEVEGDFESKFKVTIPTITMYENNLDIRFFNDSKVLQIKESLKLKPEMITNSNEIEIDDLMKEYSELQYKSSNENKQIITSISLGIIITLIGVILIIIILYLHNKLKLAVLESTLEKTKREPKK